MRRINRRLVFLSIVLACDFACVFGRPQSTPSNHLKDDVHNNRYTGYSMGVPRLLTSQEKLLNTSKILQASDISYKLENTQFTKPDPLLQSFLQFLLNSSKRKKRNFINPLDTTLVQNFIQYSLNELKNPGRSNLPDTFIPIDSDDDNFVNESDKQYLPVSIYTNIQKPKPMPVTHLSPSISLSGAIYPTSTHDPLRNWQETPLVFPSNDKKPTTTRPSFSNYYSEYELSLKPNSAWPTFMTPVELQAPTFITPNEYQGPTFITPISVTQSTSIGSPPPTIVILDDIDPEAEDPSLNDPIIESDPTSVGGATGASSGGSAAAATAAAAGGIGAAIATGGIVGAGIAGGSTALATAGSTGGSGNGGEGNTPTVTDVIQCRGASKVCSSLVTTASTSSSSDTFLDYAITLLTSLNIFGPLAMTFWAMLFPPMSIIITSGLAIISFFFPWLIPRVWL